MNTVQLTQSILAIAMIAVNMPGAQAQAPGQTSTPAEFVDALHSAFGKHEARAVHAKGIILEGDFTPDKHASRINNSISSAKAKQ